MQHPEDLHQVHTGDHVCWILDDAANYVAGAAVVLAQGRAAAQKPIVFGPKASDALSALASHAEMTMDPHHDILGGRHLEPAAMFATFREQTLIAHGEGFTGLCVVADMDWLLPGGPTTEEVVGFEVLLDRVVTELGATVVCAYHRHSFDSMAINGLRSVHPVEVGVAGRPMFRLVSSGADRWQLAGEIDLATEGTFAAALSSIISDGASSIDVESLEFIGVSGMRIIAQMAHAAHGPLELHGVTTSLQHVWTLAGFDAVAPEVRLVA